jgi:opacity protein-like surface antigen
MKKLLSVVLLAVALVVPAFAAEKGSMEIDGKLGVLFSPTMKMEAGGYSQDGDFKTTFSLGADFFYYVEEAIAVGAGLEYVVPSEADNSDGSLKYGTTNLFVQAKYDFAVENDIFNNIYPILQLGYGINSASGDMADVVDVKNGLYWGIGVGTTIKENFIVELLYAFNYGKVESKGIVPMPDSIDTTYKAFRLKVGYKFAI